jgi:glycosyltransferase involved in cell wall biosynthesis
MDKVRISEMQAARSANFNLLRQANVTNGVSFCIITGRRTYSDIEKVVESIQRLNYPYFEIIVIGNIPSLIQGCITLSNRKAVEQGWFGSLRNQGAAAAKFTTLVFLNDDITLDASFGSILFEYLLTPEQNNNWFVAQPRILNPDGTRYWDWATYGGPRGHCLLAYSHKDPETYLQSSAYIIKRSVATSILWPEEASSVFPLDEVEYTRALRAAGFSITCVPSLTTHHLDPNFVQIDDYPRKIYERFKLESLGDGLFGRGFYPPEINGARLLEEKSEIIISKDLLNTSGVISFILQSHAQDLYDEWPLTIKLLNGDSEVATVTFKRGGERHHVYLPIAASKNDLTLSLVANSTIVSKLSVNHRDDKVFSVFLGELTYEQKSNLFSLVEPISAKITPSYTRTPRREECVVISPHLSSLAIGCYSRRLLANLAESGLKIEVDTYLAEVNVINEITKSENNRSFWHNIHRNQVSGGTCVTFFPLEIASNPRIIRRIRELHSDCHYSILLTYVTRVGQLEDLQLATELFDEVWLPSEYQAKIFAQHGINKKIIRIVPPGVDTELYNPENITPLPLAVRGDFTLLSDIPLSRDSGWQELLLAYFTQFTRTDDVALILRIQEFGAFAHVAMEQIRVFLRNNDFDHPGAPALYLFDASRVTEEHIPQLYALADIFVLPNALEIWPHLLLRPMALGLPVIASNVGSNSEFVDEQVGALIAIKEGNDSLESSLAPQLNHRPQVSALGKLMREAFENRTATTKRSEAARQRVVEKWSLATTTELVRQRVFHAFDNTKPTSTIISSSASTNSGLIKSQASNSKATLSSEIERSKIQPNDSDNLKFGASLDMEYGERLCGIGVKAESLIADIRSGHTPAIYTQYFLRALSAQKTLVDERLDCRAEITLYANSEEKIKQLKELFPTYQALILNDEGANSTFEIIWDCSPILHLNDNFDPLQSQPERHQKLSSKAILTRVIDDLLPISRRESYFDRWSSDKKSRFVAALSEEARKSDHFFTFSRQAETLIAKTLGIDTAKITVLSGTAPEYSLPLNRKASEESKFQIQPDLVFKNPYIISAGSLSAHRNIPSLLLAVEQVRLTAPVDLVFLHPPDEEIISYYQTLCIRNRLEGIRFIANDESNQSEIQSLLAGATAMVFATSHASLLIEPFAAAQASCTIVSPPSRELSEIIGNNYFMIANEYPEEMAGAIIHLVSNPRSTEQLREQAAQLTQRYSWSLIGQKIIQKLITLVNTKLNSENNILTNRFLLNNNSNVDLPSLFT